MSIGETTGIVVKPKDVGEMQGGYFMRVRIEVDITKPLCRGRKFTWGGQGNNWVSFMYECRTFVTGVGKSLMMTKIAFYGLAVKELYN